MKTKSKNNKKSPASSLYSKFLEIDYFGDSITFQKDGSDKLRTNLGAIISLCIVGIVIAYSMKKFEVMQDYGDTIH